MKYIVGIVVFLALCGSVSAQAGAPAFVKWAQTGDYVYNKRGDSLLIILGSDTLWISAAGLYWEPATPFDSTFLDSLRTAAGRFDDIDTNVIMQIITDSSGLVMQIIADSGIQTGDIENATILFEDWAQNSATDGKIPKWSGGKGLWEAADDLTGAGPWGISGNFVILNEINDSVGIGTATPSTKLEVVGETTTDTLIVDTILTIGGDVFNELVGDGLQITAGSLQTVLGTSIDLTSEVTGELPDANIVNVLTVTGYMQDEDINTFDELQSWVSDKTLVNEEDIFTIDENWVNTANPWADNEVADNITIDEADDVDPTGTSIAAALNTARDSALADIRDTVPILVINADSIQGIRVSPQDPTSGQLLKYNTDSTAYVPADDATGGAGAALVVYDDSVLELNVTDTMNFQDAFTLLNSGDGWVDVYIDSAWLNATIDSSDAAYADSAGSSANENVQDKVGAMTTGNTESGITVAYQDGDGTIDFTVTNSPHADSSDIAVTHGGGDNIETILDDSLMWRDGRTAATGNWSLGNRHLTSVDSLNTNMLWVNDTLWVQDTIHTPGGLYALRVWGATITATSVLRTDSIIAYTGDFISIGDTLSMQGHPLVGVPDPANDSDAVNLKYLAAYPDTAELHDTADVLRNEMSSDADSLVGIDIQAKTGNLQNDYILKVDIVGADTTLKWEADATGNGGGDGNPIRADTGVVVTFDSLILREGTGIEMTIVTATGDDTLDIATTLGTDIDSSEITGIVPAWNGGTGVASLTAGGILYGNGTGPIANSGVLGAGMLFIGDADGAPTTVAMSGDAVMPATGVIDLEDSAVTYGEIDHSDVETNWLDNVYLPIAALDTDYVSITVDTIYSGDTTTGDVDVFHYFATDGSWAEYLKWDDGNSRFELSDEFLATHLYASNWGGVGASWRIGYWGATATPALYFWKDGASNGASLSFDTTTDKFSFSDELIVAGGITVPDNSISDEELDEDANFTWTGTNTWTSCAFFDKNIGGDDSPDLDFVDGSDNFFRLKRYNAGFSALHNSAGGFRIVPCGDANNYIIIDTAAVNVPMISTAVNCDLVINASSGEISFGDENLTTTGTLDAGATSVTGNITVTGTVDTVDVAALGATVPLIADDTTTWKNVATLFDTNYLVLIAGGQTIDDDTSIVSEGELEDTLDAYALSSALHTRSHVMTSTSDHTAGNHKVFYSDGSGDVQELAHGTDGYVLTSNGVSANPTWQETVVGDGDLRIIGDCEVTGRFSVWGHANELDFDNAHCFPPDSWLYFPSWYDEWSEADSTACYGKANVLHPALVDPGEPLFTRGLWMGYDPYCAVSQASLSENPHVACSKDNGLTWIEYIGTDSVEGVGYADSTWHNPLWDTYDTFYTKDGSDTFSWPNVLADHFSDQGLGYDVSGNLRMPFRSTWAATDTHAVFISVTTDGVNWSSPVPILSHGLCGSPVDEWEFLCPVWKLMSNGKYAIWTAEIPGGSDTTIVVKWTSDYPDSAFTLSDTCDITASADTCKIWHFDIIPNGPDELVMLATECSDTSGNGDYNAGDSAWLSLYRSIDEGVSWELMKKEIWVPNEHDDSLMQQRSIYKATGSFKNKGGETVLGIYGTVVDTNNTLRVHHIAYTEISFSAFTDTGYGNAAGPAIVSINWIRDSVFSPDTIQVPIAFELVPHGVIALPSDSVKLTFPKRDTLTLFACRDSIVTGADQWDTIAFSIPAMPHGTIRMDSIVLIYRMSSATSTDILIDKMLLRGHASASFIADSTFIDSTADLSASSADTWERRMWDTWSLGAANKSAPYSAGQQATVFFPVYGDAGEYVDIHRVTAWIAKEQEIQ